MAVTRIKNNQLTDGTINAAAKLQDFSLTSGKFANNLTYGSDLTVTGNLTVQGNVTAVDTYDLVVEDPLILLAKDQTGTPTLDIGFIGERGDSDNIAFVWDESAERFVAAFTADGSGSTNTTITVNSYASMQVLTLTASDAEITGNLIFDGTVDGNITVTGNVDAGNISANASVTAITGDFSGNVTASWLTANNGVAASFVNVSGNITGNNVTSNNIVSSDTVAAIGNISGGNLISSNDVTTATVTASGNITGDNVVANNDVTTATVTASGNITGDNVVANNDVTTATVTASGNITGQNLISNANIDGVTVSASGDLEGNNAVVTNDVSTATVTANGNITGQNLISNANIDGVTVSASGDLEGNNAVVTNDVSTATVSASGDITGQNLISNANIDGVTVSASGNLEGNNAVITNDVSTATITASGNITGQNITSNANIDGVTVSASGNLEGNNAVVTNDVSTATVSASGNITGDNVVSNNDVTTATVSASGNITGQNLISNANIDGVTVTASGDLEGNNAVVTNDVSTATVSASGNITGDNVVANNDVTTATVTASGNITGQNLISNANIDGVTVTASGNLEGNNAVISGDVSTTTVTATGNVDAGAVNTDSLNGNLTISTTGDLSLDLTGNVQMGGKYIKNLADPDNAQDAATKQYVDDAVSSGITIHDPVQYERPISDGDLDAVYAQGGNVYTVTETVADDTVVFSTAANLQVNDQLWFTTSFNGIVANKAYFVVSTPNTSAAVLSATYNGDPITDITSATGLTESTRVNSGQGATLTDNSGSPQALTIDGATVVLGDRVLIYNQTNAAENGVYVVTTVGDSGTSTPWVLTRASDMDTYIPDDILGVDTGDYFFVEAGDEGAGESYVMTDPVGPIIIGYDELTFTQFSSSQVYSAGAGLALTGTAFSVNVDDDTTAIVGDAVVVKSGANLVTPNIGDATGNSLTLSGNGLLSATTVSASGNITGQNLTSNANIDGVTITASGDLEGNNAVVTNDVSTATVSASGNITGQNLTSNANIDGVTVTASGNLEGNNAVITNDVSTATITASGNITGDNVVSNNDVTTATVSASGNITGQNLISNANIDGVTVTASGNLEGNNAVITNDVSTATVSASGNITGDNVVSNNDVTTATVSASGNITGQNLISNANIDGVTVTASGNITGQNLISNANIDGVTVTATTGDFSGNVTASWLTANNGVIANFVNVSGNITGQNLFSNANIDGVTVTASGDLEGNNAVVTNDISTATVSASGNITGDNVVANNDVTTATVTASGNITGQNLISNANIDGVTVTASGNLEGNNAVVTNDTSSDTFTADTSVTTPLVTSAGALSLTTSANANITLDPDGSGVIVLEDETANRMLFTGANKEIATDANATFDGANLVITGQLTVDNVTVDGQDITSSGTELTINDAGGDVDFRVEGGTDQNLLLIDAGTDTVLIGTSTTISGAKLVVDSTESIVVPVGTTLERPAVAATGMLRFNSTSSQLEYYDNTAWVGAGTDFTIITSDSFTGDGSTVAFTLSESATTAGTIISINGVVQIPTTAYSVSGTTLTFTEAPVSDDVIDARILVTTDTVVGIVTSDETGSFESAATGATFESTANIVPSADLTYSLGNATNAWDALYVGGNTIFLGNLQLKEIDATTFGVFASDGVTTADLDVGNIDVAALNQGNSTIGILGVDGNAYISIDGTANVVVVDSGGANIAGNVSVTGNVSGTNLTGTLTTAAQPNITSVGTLTSLSITGNLSVGGLETTDGLTVTGDASIVGNLTVQGNTITTDIDSFVVSDPLIQLGRGSNDAPLTNNDGFDRGIKLYYYSGEELLAFVGYNNDEAIIELAAEVSVANNVITVSDYGTTKLGNIVSTGTGSFDSAITVPSISKSGTNGVGNIGSAGNAFDTVFAKATSAQYADLAEMYEADQPIEPGTVVHFGGDKEVTVCDQDACARVAGVVSTNPSYLMNSQQPGKHVIAVALTGRVPVQVIGSVRKGDMMVSAGNGHARSESAPGMGTVIGKALEDFDGESGVIEVVVGRL